MNKKERCAYMEGKIKTRYKSLHKKNIEEVLNILEAYYKDASCSLNYNTPYELVIALILAAQCTDERVNKILPIFMSHFKSVQNVANSNVDEIIHIIKPCGYYNSKASSILQTSKIIVNDFNGNVPNTMENLLKLKGIGRKSANIILQECFQTVEGIAVDTHVTRISRKIGLSNGKVQSKIETELMKKINKKYYSKINHIFVYHGRAICIAGHPKCNECPINNICMKND